MLKLFENQKVSFNANLVYLPEGWITYKGNIYKKFGVEGKNLGLKEQIDVLATDEAINKTIMKKKEFATWFYDETLKIVGKVAKNGAGKLFILADELRVSYCNNNKKKEEKFNEVSCRGIVSVGQKYCYTKDNEHFFEIRMNSADLNRKIKVIISESILNKALSEAFVKKVYKEVGIWVSGKYEEGIDNYLIIYAEDFVLIDDYNIAFSQGKVTKEEYDINNKKIEDNIITFKAFVLREKENGELSSNFSVETPNWKRIKESYLVLSIENSILKKALSDADILTLHVGDELFVKANLKSLVKANSYDSISTLIAQEVKVIFDDIEETKNNKNSTMGKYKFDEIIYSNLSKKEKALVFAKRLKENELKKATDYVRKLNIKENVSSFIEGVKDKFNK